MTQVCRVLSLMARLIGYHGRALADLFGVESWRLTEDEDMADDERLLDRLSELSAMLDPVPGNVLTGARAAFRLKHGSESSAGAIATRRRKGNRGLSGLH